MYKTLDVREYSDKHIQQTAEVFEHLLGGNDTGLCPTDYLTKTSDDINVVSPTVLKPTEAQLALLQDSLDVPTPHKTANPRRQLTKFELLQLVVAHSIGQPMSIEGVRQGAVIQDIIPQEEHQDLADSSHGSSREFAFHNDMSFLDDDQVPYYFTLGCTRNYERAATLLADPLDALNSLDENTTDLLRAPLFRLCHTYNRGQAAERTSEKISPIITPEGEVQLGVNVKPGTTEGADALGQFRNLLGQTAIAHVLEPGEVLIVPNRFFVHARTSFQMANNASERRWIQRTNIKKRKASPTA